MRRMRHHAYAGVPIAKSPRNRGGHFGTALRHALHHHTVVGAEHRDHPTGGAHLMTALRSGDAANRIFYHAQSVKRLGKPVPAFTGLLSRIFVGMADIRHQPSQMLDCIAFGHVVQSSAQPIHQCALLPRFA